MTRHRTPWVIALIALALTAPAIGQDRGGRDDRSRDRPSTPSRSDPPGQRPGQGPAPRMQPPRLQAPHSPPPRMDRGDRRDRNDRGDRDRADRGRGAGPDHGLYRGSRLPQQYRGRPSVVDDWRGHRLSAPPRGYHWVQVGADYVLVAIATGIILQLILDQ